MDFSEIDARGSPRSYPLGKCKTGLDGKGVRTTSLQGQASSKVAESPRISHTHSDSSDDDSGAVNHDTQVNLKQNKTSLVQYSSVNGKQNKKPLVQYSSDSDGSDSEVSDASAHNGISRFNSHLSNDENYLSDGKEFSMCSPLVYDFENETAHDSDDENDLGDNEESNCGSSLEDGLDNEPAHTANDENDYVGNDEESICGSPVHIDVQNEPADEASSSSFKTNGE